jgi:NACalpha-BTF3-like transcription factor
MAAANLQSYLLTSFPYRRKQQIDRSNISKENTDLIVAELNVPKLVAETALLDNNNDVRAALTQLITQ